MTGSAQEIDNNVNISNKIFINYCLSNSPKI